MPSKWTYMIPLGAVSRLNLVLALSILNFGHTTLTIPNDRAKAVEQTDTHVIDKHKVFGQTIYYT